MVYDDEPDTDGEPSPLAALKYDRKEETLTWQVFRPPRAGQQQGAWQAADFAAASEAAARGQSAAEELAELRARYKQLFQRLAQQI